MTGRFHRQSSLGWSCPSIPLFLFSQALNQNFTYFTSVSSWRQIWCHTLFNQYNTYVCGTMCFKIQIWQKPALCAHSLTGFFLEVSNGLLFWLTLYIMISFCSHPYKQSGQNCSHEYFQDDGHFISYCHVFGRPFVKRFALCYQTVVCSVSPVCL